MLRYRLPSKIGRFSLSFRKEAVSARQGFFYVQTLFLGTLFRTATLVMNARAAVHVEGLLTKSLQARLQRVDPSSIP